MAMCKHSQEFETCRFGCTFRQAADLRLENDKLEEELEEYRATFGNQGLLQKAETENTQLQAENDRLKEAFEWFRTDLKEIKTMNEPTFFTICQRWMPHIDQVLQDKDGANAGGRDAPLKEQNDGQNNN